MIRGLFILSLVALTIDSDNRKLHSLTNDGQMTGDDTIYRVALGHPVYTLPRSHPACRPATVWASRSCAGAHAPPPPTLTKLAPANAWGAGGACWTIAPRQRLRLPPPLLPPPHPLPHPPAHPAFRRWWRHAAFESAVRTAGPGRPVARAIDSGFGGASGRRSPPTRVAAAARRPGRRAVLDHQLHRLLHPIYPHSPSPSPSP
jgi:hypothetical protein